MSPLPPPLFIRLSILQKLNSLSTLSENCLDNNFLVSVWAENGGEAVAGDGKLGAASWRKRNETDGNDKKLIGQYRHQLKSERSGRETFCTIIYQSFALYLCFEEFSHPHFLLGFWKMLSLLRLSRTASLHDCDCQRADIARVPACQPGRASHEHILVHSKLFITGMAGRWSQAGHKSRFINAQILCEMMH